MNRPRLTLAIAGALLILACPISEASVAVTLGTSVSGYGDDANDSVGVSHVGDGSPGADGSGGSGGSQSEDQYFRADTMVCVTLGDIDYVKTTANYPDVCPENTPAAERALNCQDDAYELAALWVRRQQEDGSLADPEQVTEGQCVTPADLATQAQQAFAAMRITAPTATVQARQPLLVNVHYPAYATTRPQTRQVTLLDVPVHIRADPIKYTWDFDDPHTPDTDTLTTTDPGHPWTHDSPTPDHTWIGHTYTHLGDPTHDPDTHTDDQGDRYRDHVTVTLTTTWQGSYRIAGTSTWTTIDGTITTTSTTDPLTITEARVRLHCDDLHGTTTC